MKHKVFNTMVVVGLFLQSVMAFAQDNVEKSIEEFSKRADIIARKYFRERDSLYKRRLMSVKNSGDYWDIVHTYEWSNQSGEAVARGIAEIKNSRYTVDEAIEEFTARLNVVKLRFKTQVPKFQKTKDVSYSYPVAQNQKLIIENRFGDVTVNTWDKPEIKIDVRIRGFGDSESIATKAIDYGDVLVDRQDNAIKFKWAKMYPIVSNTEYCGQQTDYIIYMPANNPLSIKTRHGDVSLPDLKGVVEVETEYGTLTTQALSNAAVNVKSTFTSLNIKSIKGGNITLSHSNASIANVGDVKIAAEYSPITIDNLSGISNFNLKFGNEFKVNNINKGIKKVTIDASYLSLVFKLSTSAGFNFNIASNDVNFKYDKTKMTKYTRIAPKAGIPRVYKGHYGKQSDAQLIITSKTCSIKFM